MNNIEQFTEFYKHDLAGTYHSTDRLTLNGYFCYSCSPGGLREFWRRLFGGDNNLDNTHLSRFAGRFSRRIRAFAGKTGIPLIYTDKKTGKRKDEISKKYLPANPSFKGIFCIIAGRASAPLFNVRRFGKTGIEISRKMTFCQWYNFHIMDVEWGHIIIRLCPHPPFNILIVLNGHEYVERKALHSNVKFTKENNCFTYFSSGSAVSKIADTMSTYCAGGHLEAVLNRWIYSACLCFALTTEEQKKVDFRYSYYYYQMEYSLNLLFKNGKVMEKTFDEIIDKNRSILDIRKVRKILGANNRPLFKKGKRKEAKITVEKPDYNLTVFKITFDLYIVKIYSKGERVLRFEATVNNARKMRCPRNLSAFEKIHTHLKQILNNFAEIISWTTYSTIPKDIFEAWYKPVKFGKSKIAGLNINAQRTRNTIKAVLSNSLSMPYGFNAKHIVESIRDTSYSTVMARYDLKKLIARKLLKKSKNGRKYIITEKGTRELRGALLIRNKLVIPLCAKLFHNKYERIPLKYKMDESYKRLFTEAEIVLNTFKATG